MMEKQLPEGWVETTIGNISEKIQYGYTAKSGIRETSYRYLRITDIQNGRVKWENVPFCEIEPEKVEKFLLKENDIVFARTGATVGKSYMIGSLPFPSVFASYLIRVSIYLTFEPKFIKYFFSSLSYWNQITDSASGIGQPNVNAKKLGKVTFPLPPLGEQRRIVAKLDGLMGHVEELQARMARIPELLKTFRQSVLTQAVTGKLTEEWREGRELGEWESTRLSNLVSEKPRNGFSPKGVGYITPVKSMTLSATTSGRFNPSYVKYLDIKKPDNGSYLWLKKGDILVQRSNTLEYVGTSAVYDQPDFEFIYPDLMMKIKVNNRVINYYMHYCLSEKNVKEYFKENASGTAGNMPKINQKVVLGTPIPLPPLSEQEEIVRQVKSLFAKADAIEARYEVLKERLDHLPQALLAKAFRGELVPQLPEEGDAKDLLEEIREMRKERGERGKG